MKFKRFLLVLLLFVSAIALVGCGAQGPQGEPGIKGETGDKGPDGKNGEDGEDGPQGLPGEKGNKGETGAQGDQGDKGDKGETGDYLVFRLNNGVLEQKYSQEGDDAWRTVIDLSIALKYRYKYNVTLDVNGGVYADAKQQTTWNDQTFLTEIELPAPTKAEYVFKGWSDGQHIYEAGKFQISGSFNLVAIWAPEGIEVSVGENNHATKFVSAEVASMADGTTTKTTNKKELTFGTDLFATLTSALEKAVDNDIIYVAAGTYEEAVTVTAKNVTIIGPNYGVHGNGERTEEAIYTKRFTIKGENVTVDGIKFTEEGAIDLGGAKGVTLNHIYAKATPWNCGETVNRFGVIGAADACSDVKILNSYVNSGASTGQRDCIDFEGVVNNLTIEGCYLTNECASCGITEQIIAYNIQGVIRVANNELVAATDNYSIFFGQFSNTAERIDILENKIYGLSDSLYNCGIRVQKATDTQVINIMGNELNMAGNSFAFNDSVAGAEFNIKYNYFTREFKLTNAGNGATVVTDHNIYAKGIKTAAGHNPDTTKETTYETKEAMMAAYAVVKVAETIKVTYAKALELKANKIVDAKSEFAGQEIEGIKFYATLDEAFKALEDNDVVYLVAGDYSLTATSTKVVTLVGPNAGVHGHSERVAEAAVNFANDNNYAAANKSLTMDGIQIFTAASNKSILYPVSTCEEIIVKNCTVVCRAESGYGVNSFIRTNDHKGTTFNVLVENCSFARMDQFLVMLGHNGVKCTANIQGNYFTNCELVGSQLVRIMAGSNETVINVYNNEFDGDLKAGTIFRAQSGTINVKYNTFKDVTKFVGEHDGSVIFDQNLYLDAEGNVLTTVPATVSGKNVTADAKIFSSEEERAAAYEAFVNGTDTPTPDPEPEVKTPTANALATKAAGAEIDKDVYVLYVNTTAKIMVVISDEGTMTINYFNNASTYTEDMVAGKWVHVKGSVVVGTGGAVKYANVVSPTEMTLLTKTDAAPELVATEVEFAKLAEFVAAHNDATGFGLYITIKGVKFTSTDGADDNGKTYSYLEQYVTDGPKFGIYYSSAAKDVDTGKTYTVSGYLVGGNEKWGTDKKIIRMVGPITIVEEKSAE